MRRSPRCFAAPGRSSLSTTSSTAWAAAAGSGSETCEVTWTKPSSKQRSSISGVVTTADTGMPPPSVFDRTRKSGTTS